MSGRVWLMARLVLVAAGGATGCHHRPHPAGVMPSASHDSLAGIISITGTALEQHIVLRGGGQTRELAASATDSAALLRLGGVEIVAYGTARTDRFAVTFFTVIAVSGATVVDGVLLRDGTRFALRTRTAQLPLGNPPAAFEQLIGARVWISGPLDSGPNSYGLITPGPR